MVPEVAEVEVVVEEADAIPADVVRAAQAVAEVVGVAMEQVGKDE